MAHGKHTTSPGQDRRGPGRTWIHRVSRLAALASLGIMLASSTAGCGGTSATSAATHTKAAETSQTQKTVSAPPLTRAQLIAKADAICGRVNRMIFLNPYRSRADIARLAPQIAALETTTTEEMAGFVPPASLAVDWRRLLADSQRRARDTAKLGEYAATGNFSKITNLLETDAPIETDMLATAQRAGFKVCAEAP